MSMIKKVEPKSRLTCRYCDHRMYSPTGEPALLSDFGLKQDIMLVLPRDSVHQALPWSKKASDVGRVSQTPHVIRLGAVEELRQKADEKYKRDYDIETVMVYQCPGCHNWYTNLGFSTNSDMEWVCLEDDLAYKKRENAESCCGFQYEPEGDLTLPTESDIPELSRDMRLAIQKETKVERDEVLTEALEQAGRVLLVWDSKGMFHVETEELEEPAKVEKTPAETKAEPSPWTHCFVCGSKETVGWYTESKIAFCLTHVPYDTEETLYVYDVNAHQLNTASMAVRQENNLMTCAVVKMATVDL